MKESRVATRLDDRVGDAGVGGSGGGTSSTTFSTKENDHKSQQAFETASAIFPAFHLNRKPQWGLQTES